MQIQDTQHSTPVIGQYYSPYETGDVLVSRLIKEDEEWWYFENKTRHPKSYPWTLYLCEKPADAPEHDENEPYWKYEDYSLWSRQIAANYTVAQIEKGLNICLANTGKYAAQHLAAIEKTTSMQSNSQRRAQSRNNVTGNYERKRAYMDALELHRFYPERCKK